MSSLSKPVPKSRVAYIIDGLSMGGAERLMVPILKYLDRDRFEPYVCALQSKDGNPMADEIRSLGIAVECLEIKHLRDLNALPRLTKYLKGIGADLVHTQLEFANILGNISAKLLRLPSVCTIHVMPSLDVKTKMKFHQRVEWFVLRYFCNRVIAVSEEARQLHIDMGDASLSQVMTVYNGIDLAMFRNVDRVQERAAVRSELKIPSDANMLITVAVLRPQKGIQFMIRALPTILRSCSKTYYVIVGDGPHKSALIEEVDRAGMKDHVIFTGMRKDVGRLMAAGDLFVFPTLTEALPTVLAEAMAARLPIVSTRVGGIPEMIDDGRNGCLVDAEDVSALSIACIRLLADPEKRAALAMEGWMTVDQKFNIERQVESLEEIYVDQLRAYGTA